MEEKRLTWWLSRRGSPVMCSNLPFSFSLSSFPSLSPLTFLPSLSHTDSCSNAPITESICFPHQSSDHQSEHHTDQIVSPFIGIEIRIKEERGEEERGERREKREERRERREERRERRREEKRERRQTKEPKKPERAERERIQREEERERGEKERKEERGRGRRERREGRRKPNPTNSPPIKDATVPTPDIPPFVPASTLSPTTTFQPPFLPDEDDEDDDEDEEDEEGGGRRRRPRRRRGREEPKATPSSEAQVSPLQQP